MAAEATLARLFHQQFNGRLVIQDHLRFTRIFARGALAHFQQQLGFEQGVGITLQATGVPGQIDQQPVIYLPRMSTRRAHFTGRLSELHQFLAYLQRQVKGFVGAIIFEELALVAHRRARVYGCLNLLPDAFALRGDGNVLLKTEIITRGYSVFPGGGL